eukprot:186933_1
MDAKVLFHINGEWLSGIPSIRLNPDIPMVAQEHQIVEVLIKTHAVSEISLIEDYDMFICHTLPDHSKDALPVIHPMSHSLSKMGFREADMKVMFIEKVDGESFDFAEQLPILRQRTQQRQKSILKHSEIYEAQIQEAGSKKHVGILDQDENILSGSAFQCMKMPAVIGAFVTGLDPKQTLTAETVSELKSKLLLHKVLVIRSDEADELSGAEFASFARSFGETFNFSEITSLRTDPACQDVHLLDANSEKVVTVWHSDVPFIQNPPALSILCTRPSLNTSIHFGDCVCAHSSLPTPLSERAASLCVRFRQVTSAESGDTTEPSFVHPLVRVHSINNEVGIFLGGAEESAIQGLSASDSSALIEELSAAQSNLACMMTYEPEAADIVLWDNHCVVYRFADVQQTNGDEYLALHAAVNCE